MGGKGSGKPKGCKNKDQSKHWTPEKKKAWSKEYYQKNKQKQADYCRWYRKTNAEKIRAKHMALQPEITAYRAEKRRLEKLEVMNHYSNGTGCCVRCGFSDIRALQIDHINGGGTKHRVELGRSGEAFYRWLRMNNYPEGYQVLCCNCNGIKRFENKEFRYTEYGTKAIRRNSLRLDKTPFFNSSQVYQ